MYASGTLRGGLVATTAIMAVGLVFVWPDLQAPTYEYEVLSLASDDGKATQKTEQSEVFADRTLSPDPAAPSPIADAIAAAPRQRALSEGSAALDLEAPLGVVRALDAPRTETANTEAFANLPPSSLNVTSETPVSTFSIDVDTASYAILRSSLLAGQRPPSDAIRVEEMVNYFTYDYPGPDGAHPFEPTVTVTPTPWNPDTRLVHIGIQGTPPALDERKPVNLVFLVDTSGSMSAPEKLPLLQQSLRLMLPELGPEDEVGIVAYAGRAGEVLSPTSASDAPKISAALAQLTSGGSTAGAAGIHEAYAMAETMAEEGEVTRVILATDGDFNVGISDPEALKELIETKRQTGIYLSVLGFGRGNLQDATMQALAQNGNGSAAFIDSLREAERVLVNQLAATLEPIADDVKIQVEFNPGQVAEYRLIGYETRALRREDFSNDAVDAGDIGAGHQVTALYEVTPVGSPAIRNDALRYAEARTSDVGSEELGFLKIRYKRPGAATSTLIEQPIAMETDRPSEDASFAMAVAGFGELLRGGTYQNDWGIAAARALAEANRGQDRNGLRGEAVSLMRLAEAIQP